MKQTLLFILLIFFSLSLFAKSIELDSIEVLADEEQEELFQKDGYLPLAPMQKQVGIKEALQVAGTNGDPLKVLRTFAGIGSTNNQGRNSDIYIHGSKTRETLFTFNHLPIGYIFHLGGLHSAIAPEMTQQIDAYLGGFDVTYGAMGAVIDITPEYPKGSNKGRLHIGLYDADFAYDIKITKDTSLFIGGRRSYFDLFASKILDELAKDEEDERKKTTFTLFPQFYDGQLILTHRVGDSLLSLEMLTSQDQLKLNDSFNVEKDPVAVGKVNIKIASNTIGARWLYLGESLTSNTLLYRLNTKRDSSFFGVDYFINTNLKEYGLYHESVFKKDNHQITAGTELKYTVAPLDIYFTSRSFTDFDEIFSQKEAISFNKTIYSQEYIFFAQDIWNFTPNYHLRYGLRGDKTDYQNFGSTIDPRVALVYNFSDTFTLSGAIGKYSQLPDILTTLERFGNPQIDTQESSLHYTLSFQKQFTNSDNLIIEPYFKTFTNLAIADDIKTFEAIGEGEAYGIDITYKKNINHFNLTLAYSYLNAKRTLNSNSNTQYRFEGDIPHTLQLSTGYQYSNGWRVSLYARYNSGTPYTPIIGTQTFTYENREILTPIYGKPYSKRQNDIYDLDIQVGTISKYSNGQSLEYYVELLNLNALIRTNTTSIKYNDKYEEDGSVEELGFLPAIHLTYRF